MGFLGILAFAATIHLFPAEGAEIVEEKEPPPSSVEASAPATPPRLELLGVERRLRRGDVIGLQTPVGRMEVLILRSEAQLQLGLLEEPLDEAVVGFAPAGVFSRKERPTGRVVVSLPILRF